MWKLYSQRYELKKYLTTKIFLHKSYYSNIVNLHRPVLCLPKDLLKGLMNLPTYVGPTCFFLTRQLNHYSICIPLTHIPSNRTMARQRTISTQEATYAYVIQNGYE